MNGIKGLRIGTVRGVDIRLHVSLIFLLAYVVMIASLNFPGVVRDSGVDPTRLLGSPFAWGVGFALALFASVLLHELGHVLVAQRMGVSVRSITLMMLGGVSEMGPIPEKPYAEFKVAIVGPLVSLALGGGLLFLRDRVDSATVELFCFWLGRVNVALGVFNLLPAFPLDGGRVFRSLAAPRLGTLRATQRAVRVSRGLAIIFGILGALSFNFLLLLIALFVYSASQAELILLASKKLLAGMKAGEVGLRVESVDETARLSEVARVMERTRMPELPVRTSHGIATVISIAQMRRVPDAHWDWVQARQVMVPSPRVLDVNEPIEEGFLELASNGVLPLVESGPGFRRVVGLVRYQDLRDVLEIRSLQKEEERPAAAERPGHDERRAA